MNVETESIEAVERGSPRWWMRQVDAYVSERNRNRTTVWRVVDQLYTKREKPGWYVEENGDVQLDKIIVPRAYSVVHGLLSQLYWQRPKFFVEPASEDRDKLAKAAENGINANWQINRSLNREMRKVVKDAIKYGIGFSLLGYETDYDEAKKRAVERFKTARDEQARALDGLTAPEDQAAIGAQLNPPGYDEESGDFKEGRKATPELDDRVYEQRVSVRRISPRQIVVDPEATCFPEVRWIGRCFYMAMDALKASDLYENVEDVIPTTVQSKYAGWPELSALFGNDVSVPTDYPVALCYEIFEKQSDGTWDMVTFAYGSPSFLRKVKAPYWLGCPYIPCCWNDDGDRLFPVSDVEEVIPQIIEEIEMRTRLHDAFKREAVDVVMMAKHLIGNDQAFKPMTVAGVGLIIPVETGMGQPIAPYIAQYPRQNKTQDVLNYLFSIANDVQSGTGLGPNQQQQPMRSGTSATEASILNSAASSRIQEKHDAVEEYIGEVAAGMFKLLAQFYDQTEWRHGVGPKDAAIVASTPLSMTDVQDGFRIYVQPGSMRKTDDASRFQLYNTMLQEYVQMPAVFAGLYNLHEIVTRRAEAMGVRDGSEVLMDGATAGSTQLAAVLSSQMQGATGSAPAASGGPSNADMVESTGA